MTSRLAKIELLATELFRDKTRAQAWLSQPNSALAGKTPANASLTDQGAAEVEALIGRLRHGVY
jgi:putative toxin-antitoxin system antitoxin component (TIGR02293 family)